VRFIFMHHAVPVSVMLVRVYCRVRSNSHVQCQCDLTVKWSRIGVAGVNWVLFI